jgi:hypothetical protein
MIVSERKLRANRENAQKSTGPKTAGGKAASSKNSVKHGLHARDIIIDCNTVKENKADYDQLLSSLIEEFQPDSPFQEYLVRKIANCIWRSRRVINAETARINRQLNNVHRDLHLARLFKNLTARCKENTQDRKQSSEDENQTRDDLIRMRSIPDISYSFNILRYEMRLDRQLSRAYRLLRHHKSRSQSGEKTKDAMGPPK